MPPRLWDDHAGAQLQQYDPPVVIILSRRGHAAQHERALPAVQLVVQPEAMLLSLANLLQHWQLPQSSEEVRPAEPCSPLAAGV